MVDPSEEPDELEKEFRELENEVRWRDCDHPHEVEITALGDRVAVCLCTRCGHRREVSP